MKRSIPREKRINLRLAADEMELIEAAAMASGTTASAFGRSAVICAARRVENGCSRGRQVHRPVQAEATDSR